MYVHIQPIIKLHQRFMVHLHHNIVVDHRYVNRNKNPGMKRMFIYTNGMVNTFEGKVSGMILSLQCFVRYKIQQYDGRIR